MESACFVELSVRFLRDDRDEGLPVFLMEFASDISLPATCTNWTTFPARLTAKSASMAIGLSKQNREGQKVEKHSFWASGWEMGHIFVDAWRCCDCVLKCIFNWWANTRQIFGGGWCDAHPRKVCSADYYHPRDAPGNSFSDLRENYMVQSALTSVRTSKEYGQSWCSPSASLVTGLSARRSKVLGRCSRRLALLVLCLVVP
jgi:hypothetical protein